MNRKGIVRATALFVAVVVLSGMALAEMDFVINAMPSSLLINTEKSFAVIDEDGARLALSSVYFMPNISAGIGMDVGRLYVDVTAGGGIIVNESFQTFMLQAGVAVMFSATDSLELGPHGGFIQFTNPEWQESTDLEVEDTTGWFLGLEMAMGDRIMYVISVDMIMGEFDVLAGSGVEPEDDAIKFTALAVQFGVRGEF